MSATVTTLLRTEKARALVEAIGDEYDDDALALDLLEVERQAAEMVAAAQADRLAALDAFIGSADQRDLIVMHRVRSGDRTFWEAYRMVNTDSPRDTYGKGETLDEAIRAALAAPPVAPAAAGTVERCWWTFGNGGMCDDPPNGYLHRHIKDDEAICAQYGGHPRPECHPFTPTPPPTADEAVP